MGSVGLALGLAACSADDEVEDESTAEAEDDESSVDDTTDENDEAEVADSDEGVDAADDEDAAAETDDSEDEATDDDEATTLGALHVEGAQLMDEDGSPVQLRGVSTHGLAWYPEYVNDECFAELRDEWGVTVVRLAMYTAESGGWCTDGDQDELREVINRGVEAAVAAGLYVIIDWHILSDGDPNTYLDEACDFFDEMSALYADVPNVIYEICNEPNGSTTWDDVVSYAEEVIPHIRANAPDAVVLVGTPNWSQYVDQAAADPIEDFDNLMYTLHFYAATHTDSLRSTLREAVEGGLPVFVSEFGICDASGSGSIDEDSANEWVELMDELGVSYVAWNLSNKDETSALISSDCSKTSGFDEDDLSESGTWLLATLSGELEGSDDEEDGDATEDEDASTDDSDDTSDELAATWELVNSWESNGSYFGQFSVTITNGTSDSISSWELTVSFSDDITLSDSWNGSYEADGSTLTITNASYNGEVASGDAVYDIGFIVSGEDELTIESVSCEGD